MDKRPLVVLLGDSVLMDGVAVGLGGRQALGVVRMDTFVIDIIERLKSLNPDLIVFELDTVWSPPILSLLREQPGVLLLGLDPGCNRVIVLNSHQHMTQTMNDLYQIIQAEVGQKAHSSKGGGWTGYDRQVDVR